MSRQLAAPQLFTTRRFVKSFADASPGLRKLARGAVHDLVRAFRSDPKTWTRRYDRVAGLKSSVLEVDVAGGERMLAVANSGQVTLLDVGDHELVTRSRRLDVDAALRSASPAAEHFYPSSDHRTSLYDTRPTHDVFDFGAELDPAWLYRLDEEQSRANERLQDLLIERIVDSAQPRLSAVVVGGPGTGKTSLLACLAEHAANSLKLRVKFVASDGVISYLQHSTLNVLSWKGLTRTTRPDLILIDDPSSLADIEGCLARAGGDVRLVVSAFDPHQLERTVSDQEFDDFVQSAAGEVLWLQDCYRQKENVGRAAKQVWDAIAAKTPYRAEDRREEFRLRHQEVTARVNELRFRNPHGFTQIYERPEPETLLGEVERAVRSGRIIRHWPSFLLVVEGLGEYHEVAPEKYSFSMAMCGLHEVESVKGLEFPHVFVVVNRATYASLLSATNGPGKKEYGNQRLLRIPFSRARDSLVTFVVDHDEPAAWLRSGVLGGLRSKDLEPA